MALYAVARDGRLELELQSPTGSRMQAEIADAAGLAPELLLNGQVQLFGVSRNVQIPRGQKIFGLISVAGAADVQLRELAPEAWTAYPIVCIADLTASLLQTNEEKVIHLNGRLRREPAANR